MQYVYSTYSNNNFDLYTGRNIALLNLGSISGINTISIWFYKGKWYLLYPFCVFQEKTKAHSVVNKRGIRAE